MNEHEQKIRERAHAIWEREGRPEGREQEHWDRAERELRAEGGLDRAGPAGASVSDVTPPTDPAGGRTAPEASPAAGRGRTGGGGKAGSSTGSAAKERTRRRSVGPDA